MKVTLSTTDNGLSMAIRGSHVPSFKNAKRIVNGQLRTERRIKSWMKSLIESIVSQSTYATVTNGSATWMEALPPSWIASLPQDDRWQIVPEIHVSAIRVSKGEEGADIFIETL